MRGCCGVRASEDNGATWRPLERLDWSGNKGGTTASGDVILPPFLTQWVGVQTLRMPTSRTADGGLTWELDRDVLVHFPQGHTLVGMERWDYPPGYASMLFWGKVYTGDDGATYGTMYGQFDEADDPCCWQAVLIRSEDEGRSWEFVSVIAGGKRGPFSEATEPCIQPLGGGRMVCAFRNGEEPRVLGMCWSEDYGRTWSKAVAAEGIRTVSEGDRRHRDPGGKVEHYSGGNVSPVFAKLGNGVLAVAYGRPGIQVAFSADGEGRRWDQVVELVPPEPPYSLGHTEGTSGMPGMVPYGPDGVLVCYDVHNYTPTGRLHGHNTIFVRTIRLS